MKKTIKIEGMHCSHCSGRVTKALEALGISVCVELSENAAYVEGNLPSDDILKNTVEDLGFDVTEIL